jgi:hypothetical protein
MASRVTPRHRLQRGRVAAADRGMKGKALRMTLDQVADLAAYGTSRTKQRKAPE